jgi:hypothetical protein
MRLKSRDASLAPAFAVSFLICLDHLPRTSLAVLCPLVNILRTQHLSLVPLDASRQFHPITRFLNPILRPYRMSVATILAFADERYTNEP